MTHLATYGGGSDYGDYYGDYYNPRGYYGYGSYGTKYISMDEVDEKYGPYRVSPYYSAESTDKYWIDYFTMGLWKRRQYGGYY